MIDPQHVAYAWLVLITLDVAAEHLPLGRSADHQALFVEAQLALPFPVSDSLYGLQPDPAGEFGIGLGAIAPRGERGALIISMDALRRISSNPFFPYMLERIEEIIGRRTVPAPGNPTVAASR